MVFCLEIDWISIFFQDYERTHTSLLKLANYLKSMFYALIYSALEQGKESTYRCLISVSLVFDYLVSRLFVQATDYRKRIY